MMACRQRQALTRCVLAELDARDDGVLFEDSAAAGADGLARRVVVLDLGAPARRTHGAAHTCLSSEGVYGRMASI